MKRVGVIGFSASSPCLSTASYEGGAANLKASLAGFCDDDYSVLSGHRDALCEESALSVLCVYCVGDAISAVEVWAPFRSGLCRLGGTGMGVECLSKY